jgi:hypothetical protein
MGRPRKYDWPALEIGDELLEFAQPKQLRASAWKFERLSGRKFKISKAGHQARAIRVK